MLHFAQIDENNLVTRVLVIDQDAVNSGLFGEPSTWIQTSYNVEGTPENDALLCKKYAGIGYTYDSVRDGFIPPKLHASWILAEDTCKWQPPVPVPIEEGKTFAWDEATTSWIDATAVNP